MDTTRNDKQQDRLSKKEMRQQLATKLTAAIPELMLPLGEKKFHSRIKKAVKLLTEGLYKKEAVVTVNGTDATPQKAIANVATAGAKVAAGTARRGRPPGKKANANSAKPSVAKTATAKKAAVKKAKATKAQSVKAVKMASKRGRKPAAR